MNFLKPSQFFATSAVLAFSVSAFAQNAFQSKPITCTITPDTQKAGELKTLTFSEFGSSLARARAEAADREGRFGLSRRLTVNENFQGDNEPGKYITANHNGDGDEYGAKIGLGFQIGTKKGRSSFLREPSEAQIGGFSTIDTRFKINDTFYGGLHGRSDTYLDNEDYVSEGRDDSSTQFGVHVGTGSCHDGFKLSTLLVNDTGLGMDEMQRTTLTRNFSQDFVGLHFHSAIGAYYQDTLIDQALAGVGGDTSAHSWGLICATSTSFKLTESIALKAAGEMLLDRADTLYQWTWLAGPEFKLSDRCAVMVGYGQNDLDGGYGQDQVIQVYGNITF